MAVISGSIAALATASKVLAGTMTKKAVMDGAKKFVKGKATNAVKNKVTGKGRKKKKCTSMAMNQFHTLSRNKVPKITKLITKPSAIQNETLHLHLA